MIKSIVELILLWVRRFINRFKRQELENEVKEEIKQDEIKSDKAKRAVANYRELRSRYNKHVSQYNSKSRK